MIRSRIFLAALPLLFAAASVQAQATAMVTCKDGSSSKGGKGACSSHGGIATATAKADAKADSKMKAASVAAPAKMAAAPTKAATAPTKMAAAPTNAATAPAKADGKPTATCKDGTQSFAKNHSGACSKHGGVKEWLDGTAKKP